MLEEDPSTPEVPCFDLAAYRESKRRGPDGQAVNEAQIERELAELDAAIVGMDAAHMLALREWADQSGPQEDERSGIVKKPR